MGEEGQPSGHLREHVRFERGSRKICFDAPGAKTSLAAIFHTASLICCGIHLMGRNACLPAAIWVQALQ